MLRDFMHAAASIPMGAAVSLLIVSIATVVAVNAIYQTATRSDDLRSLRRHQRQRDALRRIR